MGSLWIFSDENYEQYRLKEDVETVTIGNDSEHTITIQSFPFEGEMIELKRDKSSNSFYIMNNENEIGTIQPEQPFFFSLNGKQLEIIYVAREEKEKIYYVGKENEISVSADDHAVISRKGEYDRDSWFTFIKLNGKWKVINESNRLFLNGQKLSEIKSVENGDVVSCPFMEAIFLEEDLLLIRSADLFESSLPETLNPTSEMKKKYPNYHRTPRLIYDLPKEKVHFSFPSQEAEDYNRGLWLMIMPPLVMLIVMGVVFLIQPRGIFILISISMFIMSIITSSVQYFRERKNRKERSIKRRIVYTKYLEQKREELQKLSHKQREVLYFHFPSFEKMKYLTDQISDRIWERAFESEDFLQFRIGRATIPSSYEVSAGSNDMANREIDDLLEKSQEMIRIYKQVKDVPLTIDLSYGAMGLVGKKSILKREIQQLVGQLAFFHSYHDIRFIAIFDEEDYYDWEWMKWLPHFQLPYSYAKGFIYNEQTRDQLLSSIYQMIRERDLDEQKDKKRFSPHFVFIVTNRKLIAEHVILEYLEGKNVQLGFSVLFASDTRESLSENLHTLASYINEREGEITIQKGKAVHTAFQLDEHSPSNNEKFSRMLLSLNHVKGMNNSIPESVSFLELLQVKETHQLEIGAKWLTSEPSKSLAAPIGLKGRNDIVELNLHEKAHGPHGLLAGTTGSGKSEFLQTFILSLSVHYHPHEVAFLLIDYKGGGMAQPFRNMPHLLGTITNIEGSKNFSARALASINSELKKRQRLFDEYEVNHINDYMYLYKAGKAKQAMPHLFLISDEFAELKNEEPEFIKELVSTARIGRSLGVHLILATQKPGGVIDNQIWSNARFKIALKVQDANDSKEVLKNSDAANITVTGRGYLQVGNNEVYELFQSAWSGAPYLEDTVESEDEIAFVTDLGLIPISNVQQVKKKKAERTEIEEVVKEIIKVQHQLEIEKLHSPWLPPLRSRISRYESKVQQDGAFAIGIKDEPEKQSQTDYIYEWIDDGNIGIFGSSGYGKSTTILTLLLSFAAKYSPEQLHYYLFDFGNGALLPLRQLPHTGDYFKYDEQRKIEKFMQMMKAELDRRKQLFSEAEVSNIKLYNSVSKNKLPVIFITIDNFDLVKEEMPDFEAQFIQVVRDGQSLGIFTLTAATRINSIRQPLMNNLKTKIVHYLMDQSEQFGLIGRTKFDNEPIPGRALIKKEQTLFTQMYLPANGEDDLTMLEEMKQEIKSLKETYKNFKKPARVPMLPKRLGLRMFVQDYVDTELENGVIPFALNEATVETVEVDLIAGNHCLVVGQSKKGKTNVLRVMLEMLFLQEVSEIGVFDAIDRGLSAYASHEKVNYMSSKEGMDDWFNSIDAVLQERQQQYENSIEKAVFKPIIFMIDGLSRFQQTADMTIQDRVSGYLKNYSHLSFHVIVSGNANEFSKGFDSFTSELKQVRQAVLLLKKSDQSLYTLSYSRKEEEINPGFGYLVMNGREYKIQIPNASQESSEQYV
ncbi:type VII secretion protein EssC [Metabacillus fastidiosus]|uniref:type VII secretion protein EssC n=1 Tax=Metabacillus fastidiosus TaxID=1458 RepID=UPI003D29D380